MLLPIAGLCGLNLLFALPMAIANPLLLIILFVLFAIVAYIFSSFIFFIKGVQNEKPLKKGLKDFTKINGYITAVVAAYLLVAALAYLGLPEMQKTMADNFPELKKAMGNAGSNIDKESFLRMAKKMTIFLAIFGAALLYHFITTLRLLKKYAALFSSGE